MRKLITFLAILISFNAFAQQPNYGFTAKDKKDPIFIEKCKSFRQAMAANDLAMMRTFVDPNLLTTLSDRVDEALLSSMKDHLKEINRKGYRLISLKMSTGTRDNINGVDIEYIASPKFTGSDSCVFEALELARWKIKPV